MEEIVLDILKSETTELHAFYDLINKYNIKEKLTKKIENIKKNELYNSYFHGLHHSQKVCIFATILGCQQGFSEDEIEIIMDAALYHDIGRENDNEDSFHGMIGARKILKIVDSNIYNIEENKGYIKAIIDLHSMSIEDSFEKNFENYKEQYPNLDYNRYIKLGEVLLDADALDRTRFRKTSTAALNEKYLRLDFSKKMVEMAEKLNNYVALKIDEINLEQLHQKTNSNYRDFVHGIGHNFFAITDILENGILSIHEAEKKSVDFVSNFKGNNNGRLWVSVVDPTLHGVAHEKFIKNKISFHVNANNWCDPLSTKISSSKDLGLAYNSREYNDEKFILGKIEAKSIKKVHIGSPNEKIKSLNYLNCSYNIDVVKSKIAYYIKKIDETSKLSIDYTECYELIRRYEKNVVEYEKLSKEGQRIEQKIFIENCSFILDELNKNIQKWVSIAFSHSLGKPADSISIQDAVEYILYRKDLSFDIINGEIELNTTYNQSK